jgi:hypothetical protein
LSRIAELTPKISCNNTMPPRGSPAGLAMNAFMLAPADGSGMETQDSCIESVAACCAALVRVF